jgi:hypothetical protein
MLRDPRWCQRGVTIVRFSTFCLFDLSSRPLLDLLSPIATVAFFLASFHFPYSRLGSFCLPMARNSRCYPETLDQCENTGGSGALVSRNADFVLW